jgi:hypothetical protein
VAQLTASTYYVTTAGYLNYGWTAYPCIAKVFYMCQYAATDLACAPPPQPPSPPLNPPSPPSPPAPPNCAPPYNASFYCDSSVTYCYGYYNQGASFAAASAACQAMAGQLVKYESATQQYDVEQVGKGAWHVRRACPGATAPAAAAQCSWQ